MAKERTLVFSVTAADCEFQAMRGTGAGGQKRNKTANVIRCIHKPSGAVGKAGDDRSQHRNKRIAFRRMAETKEFQNWAKLEVSRRTGVLAEINRQIEKELKNVKIDVKNDDGLWMEVPEKFFEENNETINVLV